MSFLGRHVPACEDIRVSELWPHCLVCPDDVKVDFASGLCVMSRSIHDLPPYLVTTAPGYLVTGSYQTLQPVKLCWECLRRISSLLAFSQCLLYNYLLMGRLKVKDRQKISTPQSPYHIGPRVCKLWENIWRFSIVRETKIKVFSCPLLPLTPTMHLAAEKIIDPKNISRFWDKFPKLSK